MAVGGLSRPVLHCRATAACGDMFNSEAVLESQCAVRKDLGGLLDIQAPADWCLTDAHFIVECL